MNNLLNNLTQLNEVIVGNAIENYDLKRKQPVSRDEKPGLSIPKMTADGPSEITYSLAEENVSGQQRYRIEMTESEKKWFLVLYINVPSFPAKDPDIILDYVDNGVEKNVTFNEVTRFENMYKCVLYINSLAERDSIFRALSDVASNTSLAGNLTVGDSTKRIPIAPEPFFFSPLFYDYIYKKIMQSPMEQGFTTEKIEFQGNWYIYYRDNLAPKQFYYLPDSFETAVYPSGLPVAALSFKSKNGTGKQDTIEATFEYLLAPSVNKQRIDAARESVLKKAPDAKFSPLLAPSTKTLKLRLLPGSDLIEEKSARIDLQGGILDGFTMPLNDFLVVWAQLFSLSQASTACIGFVTVALKGLDPQDIPVKIRLSGDKKQILDSIISQEQPANYKKDLTFKANKRIFFSDKEVPIKSILLDVGNTTVELNKNTIEKSVCVDLPIMNIFLGVGNEVEYTYNQKIIYHDGKQVESKGLKTKMEIIYVPEKNG